MQVLMLNYGRRFIEKGQMTTGSLVSFILYQSQLGLGIMVETSLLKPKSASQLIPAPMQASDVLHRVG